MPVCKLFNKSKYYGILIAALGNAFSQSSIPHVIVSPRVSYINESPELEIYVLKNGCRGYDYSKNIDSSAEIAFDYNLKIKIDEKLIDGCVPILYMGYFRDTLIDLKPGKYKISFDSTSNLKYDLSDTAWFEIKNIPNSIMRARDLVVPGLKYFQYNILGRKNIFIPVHKNRKIEN